VRRSAIVSLLVFGALATSWIGTRALVPRLGDAMAKSMATAAHAWLLPGAAAATTVTDPGSAPAEADPRGNARSGRGGRPAARSVDPDRAPASIEVPRERVARLDARQLRAISATDALDASGHALGARLHGVGGLGVGLSDGDVVTSIDGRPTANAEDATTAAIGAYASGEASAHATVRRGDRTLRVTVHIPPREANQNAAASLSR
jgi:hypothetical protein